MKAKVPIYNMYGRASTWWEHLIKVKKKINEWKITWKQFEKHFQRKYLSYKYFDGRIKEFHHKLMLRQMTMDDEKEKI